MQWHDRKLANRYLAAHGWVRGEAGFISPDGAYRAQAATATVGATTFVAIQFEEVADQTEWTNAARD